MKQFVRFLKLPRTLIFLGLSLAFLLQAFSCSSTPDASPSYSDIQQSPVSEKETDELLQQTASAVLGDREGTILVLDPQTGRLRAVVNPRLAFEQAFPPGSAIKPFTALVALRNGVINAESRTQCREHYTHGPFTITCSHPKSDAPFNLTQALAYSCNFYFATLSERLSASSWFSALTNFGFGETTGVNAAGESAGTLERDAEWLPQLALGESDQFLTTPVQLLMAYAALVNGGQLLRPQIISADREFAAQHKARINIPDNYRSLLIKGMKDALVYGTAAKANLADLPINVFGKTGTSTDSNKFRTQGWFVGFASTNGGAEIASGHDVKLEVLVFLRRSHGSEAAEIARPVFAAFAEQATKKTVKELPQNSATSAVVEPPQNIIRVRSVSEGVTSELSLEEYIQGVVNAEAGTEEELEALKAQAIVSRTFALKNLHRHEGEGYDFCSTTHCQRFALPSSRIKIRSDVARAVDKTSGLVIKDGRGELIDSYFHASCGGMTANLRTLWPVDNAPSYLQGVRDDYCLSMPHARWDAKIPAADLIRALRSEPRSDVGNRLDEVHIIRRDETGRAEKILIRGEKSLSVSGWDFKMIVGRKLGWNLLKSSRFDVMRAGNEYIFHGSGFGHGLGLCQEGSHVMARRGADAAEIIQHYYPGTSIATDVATKTATSHDQTLRDVLWDNKADGEIKREATANYFPFLKEPIVTLSENFRFVSTEANAEGERRRAAEILEAGRISLIRRLGDIYQKELRGKIEVTIYGSTGEFVDATGQPGWVGGITHGHKIELQPLALLRRRGLLESTLRHELAHVVIETLSHSRAPRWLAEGLAVHLAGEGPLLLGKSAKVLSEDELERALARPSSKEEMRELYAAAYRLVKAQIRARGEAAMWRRVAGY